MCKKDFQFFFEQILEFQLAGHHKRWFENLTTHKRYCVKAARDHGKSTLFLAYVLWKVIFNKKTDAMIFSHSLHQSIAHMRTLNDLIDGVPMFRELKAHDSWSKTFFGFKNGSRISAKSVGGAVRGAHPDLILCDDILWGTTDTELSRVASWFYEVLTPTLHHTAQLCIVGTPFTPTDLYTELERRDGYLVETYPAINEKGVALWPERWSLEALDERRKDMPAIAFTREYLCEPMDDMSSLFPSTILQAAKNRDLILSERSTGDPDDQYFVGWDPAISSDRQADYTVMVVLRRPSSNPEQLELVHVLRRKGMDFRAQINEIQRINSRFGPEVIELESNHFQRVFATELRADTDLPVKTFISTKQRRESLLMGLVMRFENGQLILPWGDERSRDVTSTLERELLMFGMSKRGRLQSIARHDDFAMALALAHWGTTEFRERVIDLDDLMEGLI
tara:strand:+ start:1068 stop:2420 length:1353 start_codon:yes stop_codon:yes gene_type:complete